MSNLKNLVADANSGLSLRSTSKQRFGLGSFVAASTDQMLMTRGGYGSSGARGGYFGGNGGGGGAGGVGFTPGQNTATSAAASSGGGNTSSSSSGGLGSYTSPVTGVSYPYYATGSSQNNCSACSNLSIDQNSPRSTMSPFGAWFIRNVSWFHNH